MRVIATWLCAACCVAAPASAQQAEPTPAESPLPPESPAPPPESSEDGPRQPKPDAIDLFGIRFSLVTGVGMLWPVSSDTRATFGSNHLSPSIAIWSFGSKRGVHFSFDLNWRSFGEDLGDANVWSGYAGIIWLSRPRTSDAIPFVTLRAGPLLLKVPERSTRLGFGGTLETGVVLWRRLIVSGRYDVQPEQAGFNLSSLSARIGVRLF